MNAMEKLRKRSCLTQEDVAQKLGLDRSTIAKWEIGESMPRAALLPEIAKLYRCTIDDLFDKDE